MKVIKVTDIAILTRFFLNNPILARKCLQDHEVLLYNNGEFAPSAPNDNDSWLGIYKKKELTFLLRYEVMNTTALVHFYAADKMKIWTRVIQAFHKLERHLQYEGIQQLLVTTPLACRHIILTLPFVGFHIDWDNSFLQKTTWRNDITPVIQFHKEII